MFNIFNIIVMSIVNNSQILTLNKFTGYFPMKITKGAIKLDQETWLCRTHLNDLKDNIWPYKTILDHILPYLPLWKIVEHIVPFKTNFDHFRQFLEMLDIWRNSRPFRTTILGCLDLLGPAWTCLGLLNTCLTYLDPCEPIWTHLDPFGPIWTHLDTFGPN